MLDTQPDIRYDRPVYFGPGCDVAGANMVSVIRKTAFDADELGLTPAVRLVDDTAFRACLARISGINSFHGYASGESLVADERPKLPKCPRMDGCALVFTNGYPAADAPEVFEGDTASGVFGLTHNRLADYVIRMRLKPLLPPSELLEVTFGALGCLRLKSRTELGYPSPDGEYLLSGVGLTIRIEGEVADPHVNAQPPLGFNGGAIGNIDGHKEEELAFAVNEIGLAPDAFKASPMVVANSTWNGETTIECQEAHTVEAVFERVETLIVRDGPQRLERAKLRLVPLVDLADLADGTHGVLSTEVELASQLVVEELLKPKLVCRLKLESFYRQPGTRFVHSTHGGKKTLLLFGRSKQPDAGNELHDHRLSTSKLICNQEKGAALPPRPKGRGFRTEEL